MMGTSAEHAKRFAENQNIQERIVEPDELGAMAAMLSSDAASAVTGQGISVEAGLLGRGRRDRSRVGAPVSHQYARAGTRRADSGDRGISWVGGSAKYLYPGFSFDEKDLISFVRKSFLEPPVGFEPTTC